MQIFIFSFDNIESLIPPYLIFSIIFTCFKATNSQLILKIQSVFGNWLSWVEATVCSEYVAIATGAICVVRDMFSWNTWENVVSWSSLTVTYVNVRSPINQTSGVLLVFTVKTSIVIGDVTVSASSISSISVEIDIFSLVNRVR